MRLNTSKSKILQSSLFLCLTLWCNRQLFVRNFRNKMGWKGKYLCTNVRNIIVKDYREHKNASVWKRTLETPVSTIREKNWRKGTCRISKRKGKEESVNEHS